MKLLQSQKNHLFDIINGRDLSPAQFEIVERKSARKVGELATVVELKNSNFFFSFETSHNDSTSHYAIYSPGESVFLVEEYPLTWINQLQLFANWVNYLKREINAPDKWGNLHQQIDNLGIKYGEENSKFTAQEFEELSSKMDALKKQLNQLNLLPEEINMLTSKIDFLVESAKSMSKFDWKSLFIGTIVNTTLQLNLTQNNIQLLWNLIKETFTNYFLLG